MEPRNPETARKAAAKNYKPVMELLQANIPTAARVIATYVTALNNECAHHRAAARELREELERRDADE